MIPGFGGEFRLRVSRSQPETKVRTRLAGWRAESGLTQKEMASAIGIPIAIYVRLERGQHRNPRLGWLVNAAIVLGASLDDVLDDWMSEWYGAYPYSQPSAPPSDWHERPEVAERRERYRRYQQGTEL
jgi:transcriptional regulator with XRE-family HTH domain